jgi:hypothetical protein
VSFWNRHEGKLVSLAAGWFGGSELLEHTISCEACLS